MRWVVRLPVAAILLMLAPWPVNGQAASRFHPVGRVLVTPMAGVAFSLPETGGPAIAGLELRGALPLHVELMAAFHGGWSGTAFDHVWTRAGLSYAVAGERTSSRLLSMLCVERWGEDRAATLGLRGTGLPEVGQGAAGSGASVHVWLEVRVGVAERQTTDGSRRSGLIIVQFTFALPLELQIGRS